MTTQLTTNQLKSRQKKGYKLSAFEKARLSMSGLTDTTIQAREDLELLTIRELKVLAQRINKKQGNLIGKFNFDSTKTMSRMNKSELIESIWAYRQVVSSCPDHTIQWHDWHPSGCERIVLTGQEPGTFKHWTVRIGFDKKQIKSSPEEKTAEDFLRFITTPDEKGAKCKMACYSKPSKRSNSLDPEGKYQIKVWGMREDILLLLVAKDAKKVERDYKLQQARLIHAQKAKLANQQIYADRELNAHDFCEWINSKISITDNPHDPILVGLEKRAMTRRDVVKVGKLYFVKGFEPTDIPSNWEVSQVRQGMEKKWVEYR